MNKSISDAERLPSVEVLGEPLSKEKLTELLEDPSLGEDILSFPQTEGFIFALACCPKPVPENEWLSVVLGDAFIDEGTQNSRQRSIQIADICATLIQMFKTTEQAVITQTYRMPSEYAFSWDTLERFPLEQWCEGLLLADQWLEPLWMQGLAKLNHQDDWAYEKLVEELDETIGLIRLLSDVDAALDELESNPENDWVQLRQQIKDSYAAIDSYLGDYMMAGNSLGSYFVTRKPQVREQPKVGRNEACPCGSGLKYKKCCLRTTDL